jgi:hypothetical protein
LPPVIRAACRTVVGLLALAHEGGCEADLAQVITEQLERGGGVPELAALQARFAPAIAAPPLIHVELPPIASYDALLSTPQVIAGATA